MRCLHSSLTFLQNIYSLLFTSGFAARGYFEETKSDAIIFSQGWPAVKAGNSPGHRPVSLLLVKASVVAVGTHDDPQWKN